MATLTKYYEGVAVVDQVFGRQTFRDAIIARSITVNVRVAPTTAALIITLRKNDSDNTDSTLAIGETSVTKTISVGYDVGDIMTFVVTQTGSAEGINVTVYYDESTGTSTEDVTWRRIL